MSIIKAAYCIASNYSLVGERSSENCMIYKSTKRKKRRKRNERIMLVLWMCLIAQDQFLVSSQPTTNPEVDPMAEACKMFENETAMPTEMPGIPREAAAMLKCIFPICGVRKTCSSVMEVMRFMEQGNADLSSVETLNSFCVGDCIGKVLNGVAGMEKCIKEATPSEAMPSEAMPSEATPSEATPSEATQNPSEAEKALEIYCIKNPINDGYCMLLASEFGSIFEKNISNVTEPEKQTMCGAVSQLGCCATSLLALSGDDSILSVILSHCGWTNLFPACGKSGENSIIEFGMKSDIMWSDWSSMTADQKLAAEFAATKDLKSLLDKDVFASTFTTDANDKVVLNFYVDSTGVNGLKEVIKNKLTSEVPNWSNLEAAIPAVDKVTTSDVNVQENGVTDELPTTGNLSYRKMPGFFVLYSVIFLLTSF